MAPVQPAASVAATGLGIRYIGQHCYCFSGAITVGNETKPALAFTTGSGYIVGKLGFTYDITGYSAGEEIGYEIKLNGEQIVDAVYGGNITSPTTNVYEIEILLPPLTKTEVNFVGTDATGINMQMVFTGRVYGAE